MVDVEPDAGVKGFVHVSYFAFFPLLFPISFLPDFSNF
jgi:hypothetical protein